MASYIVVFQLGKYHSQLDSEFILQGTYIFDNSSYLNVFNDTYLSLSENSKEYFYISSSSQFSGKLTKIKDCLYVLQDGVLDNTYVILDENGDILFVRDNEVSIIYKYDDTLTLISP